MEYRLLAKHRFISTLLLLVYSVSPVPAQQTPEEVLGAVVILNTIVPPDARTAVALGEERRGSGVVIDNDGLILTIGYLILEATSVSVTRIGGEVTDAKIVAYDHATGFGLVRADEPLGVTPLDFGNSGALAIDDPVLIISSGNPEGLRPGKVVSRRDFSGYWEYLLDNAIFVSPPHQRFAGSALIDSNNQLVGIGSLIVRDAVTGENPVPGNMFVPIDALKPILKSLVDTGRDPATRRPWIGVYTEEYQGHVIVYRVAEDSPAERAEIRIGDIILDVAGSEIPDMATFYRTLWALGEHGIDVPLTIVRSGRLIKKTLRSADRYEWLKLGPGRLTRNSLHRANS